MLPNPIEYRIFNGLIPPAQPYAYVLAGDGLWKVAETRHFRAALHLFFTRVSGLGRYPESGVALRMPRVPATWLESIYRHACHAGQGNLALRPIEAMYHFHWFDQWRVSVPKQRAGVLNVTYQGGNDPTIMVDLHSHHAMPAEFSGVDDDDEQGCRFYVVIGRLFTQPEIRVRLGVYGDFMPVDPLVLFDGLGPFVEAR